MAGYVHIEVETVQSPKRPEWPCGDVVACARSEAATSLICADGIGSGVHAHVAAELCVSRLLELLRLDFSLRKATASVVRSMERNREPGGTFAAFSVARILNDGMTTVLAYEGATGHPAGPSPRRGAPFSPLRTGLGAGDRVGMLSGAGATACC